MNIDEVLKHAEEIRAELKESKEKAWTQTKEAVKKELDKLPFPDTVGDDSAAKGAVMDILRIGFEHGYRFGTISIMKKLMDEAGIVNPFSAPSQMTGVSKKLPKCNPALN